jgi:hypothetical protein
MLFRNTQEGEALSDEHDEVFDGLCENGYFPLYQGLLQSPAYQTLAACLLRYGVTSLTPKQTMFHNRISFLRVSQLHFS